MKTKICFIMVGVSGSGKSTAMEHLKKIAGGETQSVFSLDDSRLCFAGNHLAGVATFKEDLTEQEAYRIAFEMANENKAEFDTQVNKDWAKALKADVVFVDNTNLTRKARARWVQDARAKGFTIWAIQMMTPLDVVITRQKTRVDKVVPESDVRDMYMRQQEVLLGDEADFLLHIDGTSDAPVAMGTFHL